MGNSSSKPNPDSKNEQPTTPQVGALELLNLDVSAVEALNRAIQGLDVLNQAIAHMQDAAAHIDQATFIGVDKIARYADARKVELEELIKRANLPYTLNPTQLGYV